MDDQNQNQGQQTPADDQGQPQQPGWTPPSGPAEPPVSEPAPVEPPAQVPGVETPAEPTPEQPVPTQEPATPPVGDTNQVS